MVQGEQRCEVRVYSVDCSMCFLTENWKQGLELQLELLEA